jgi:hypothetical protein
LEIYGIPYMKKVMEFGEIPWNFTELYDTELSGIPRNFSQFCTEYGIDGSKKNRRNSVSTEFRGHPRQERLYSEQVKLDSEQYSRCCKGSRKAGLRAGETGQ